MTSGFEPGTDPPAIARELVFVKLGGSVITDKARPETARTDVIRRLAGEVFQAMGTRSDLDLVLGHGSGSFGHMEALRHGTRKGAHSLADWRGFAQVAAAAARLNRLITDTLLGVGVPVWALQPSASAWCHDGKLVSLNTAPVTHALAHRLVPLLYGDVALDGELGATIVSTEQILSYLARHLRPTRLILVGVVDGVFDGDPLLDPSARHIPRISASNWVAVRGALGGSHAVDVTGGMLSKVEEMVSLSRDIPGLAVEIISGEREGALAQALREPGLAGLGTLVRWS